MRKVVNSLPMALSLLLSLTVFASSYVAALPDLAPDLRKQTRQNGRHIDGAGLRNDLNVRKARFTMKDAVKSAEATHGGEALGAKRIYRANGAAYRVRILKDGKIKTVLVEPPSQ